jgi:addiction module HigA family antidote
MTDKNARKLAPIHPGTILREDLEDVGVSINQLGRELRVPVNRISAIVNGRRGITADTALRLAQYFGNSPQYCKAGGNSAGCAQLAQGTALPINILSTLSEVV